MDNVLVLKVTADGCVDFRGVKHLSVAAIAQALEQANVENPMATVSIEASETGQYEAVGKAIYGCHRAGFSGERLQILVNGKRIED